MSQSRFALAAVRSILDLSEALKEEWPFFNKLAIIFLAERCSTRQSSVMHVAIFCGEMGKPPACWLLFLESWCLIFFIAVSAKVNLRP